MLNVDSEALIHRVTVKPPGTDATKMDLNRMIDITRICYEGQTIGAALWKKLPTGLVASPTSARRPSPASGLREASKPDLVSNLGLRHGELHLGINFPRSIDLLE